MAKGSFAGLYTFEQVASIYNIDPSTIRKQVQCNKFNEGEIKKFGKTWIMTEQAMIFHYGREIFVAYQQHLMIQQANEIRQAKERAKREKLESKAALKPKKEIMSMDSSDEELPDFTWGEIKVNDKDIVKSFNLS